MSLTDTDLQVLIVGELGLSPLDLLAQSIPTYWALYQDKALIAPRLQYLYTRVAAIDWLMLNNWQSVDLKEGTVTIYDSQKIKNLSLIKKSDEEDIVAIEARFMQNRSAKVGAITTVTPLGPDPGSPDPGAREYRGDPLRRPFGTRI